MQHGRALEKVTTVVNDASTDTIELCDRWTDEMSLDAVETIRVHSEPPLFVLNWCIIHFRQYLVSPTVDLVTETS